MYGLDFEEFLWARGITDRTIASIKECIRHVSGGSPLDQDAGYGNLCYAVKGVSLPPVHSILLQRA